MNLFKEIFGRIWTVWGLILFGVTLLIFTFPFIVINLWKEPKRTHIFMRFTRAWMRIFLPGIGCPLTVKGREHFQKGENYIVVCNHNSLMDVPVATLGLPGGNKTIAKKEMVRIPVFGIMYRMGSVLVDRKSEKSRRESYIRMKQVLNIGLHMCLYPEGTRNKTNEPLKAFQDGAFRLALDTRKSVIPAIIFNTKKTLPLHKSFFLWPNALQMHFLEPVPVNEDETATQLKEKVFTIMKDYYVAHQN